MANVTLPAISSPAPSSTATTETPTGMVQLSSAAYASLSVAAPDGQPAMVTVQSQTEAATPAQTQKPAAPVVQITGSGARQYWSSTFAVAIALAGSLLAPAAVV